MLTRPFGSSALQLPLIGLGTWQSFDIGADTATRAARTEVLREFAALGGTMIDSSPMYGRAETVVGDLAPAVPAPWRPFIATKVWTRGKRAGIAQMEDSMRKLRAPVIDLMQVHNLLDVDHHLATLADWKASGRVRLVGVTHYNESAYGEVEEVLRKHRVDALQINYSVAERAAERRLLPLAAEQGIAVIINRPFAGGDLIRRIQSRTLPAWAAGLGCTSWAQLLLKFVVSHPAVSCAIPAMSSAAHVRDCMAAGQGPLPDAAQRARMIEAARGA